MSLSSWKKEFYPVPVEDLPTNITDEERILHSIKKWEGALPENLKKHSMTVSDRWIFDDEQEAMFFGTNSCALCEKHFDPSCSNCPLAKVATYCPSLYSAYNGFELTDDPTQVIQDLKKALVYVRTIQERNKHAD